MTAEPSVAWTCSEYIQNSSTCCINLSQKKDKVRSHLFYLARSSSFVMTNGYMRVFVWS